ncbi:MAG TPA: aspartate-semialdehyde dehydrogenase [Gemmatimonadaceae bacterium]|jgi:aspartate-semialdehyde dehydrogenase|nr:aspartate-semialdehyde dehydrogenase [Gemmatimonadaceae bacterium]
MTPVPSNPPLSSPSPGQRRRVAVLGATGAVGQAFIRLLVGHPWFELVSLAASERSAGKPYREAAKWVGAGDMPPFVADMIVQPCDPDRVDADVVFSALDSAAAGDAEPAFARAGRTVLTNAKNHRMEPDVPLVIAEVNPDHLGVIESQRKNRGWPGAIVANGNCSAIVTTLPVAPIHQAFGIERMIVVTMQAVSGAGYPGVPSLDIIGNVIPYIADEEPKIEGEVRKFLGSLNVGSIKSAEFAVSAHANRVPVEHGHTVCVSLALKKRAPADEVSAAIAEWRGNENARNLPSAPERPIVLADQPDRPQPRRQVDAGGGMTVIVGRVRRDPVFDVKLVAMGHNVIRGAAGASVLNAELMMRCGLLDGP